MYTKYQAAARRRQPGPAPARPRAARPPVILHISCIYLCIFVYIDIYICCVFLLELLCSMLNQNGSFRPIQQIFGALDEEYAMRKWWQTRDTMHSALYVDQWSTDRDAGRTACRSDASITADAATMLRHTPGVLLLEKYTITHACTYWKLHRSSFDEES